MTSPRKTRSERSGPQRSENRKKTTAADPGATTRSDDQLDDQTWLASLRIRQKLADTTAFDREALLWRHTWPEVEQMKRRIEPHRPEFAEACRKAEPLFRQYSRRMAEMMAFPPPNRWIICEFCKGKGYKGRQKEDCIDCGGGGFNSNVR
jgi:hypothetical protein